MRNVTAAPEEVGTDKKVVRTTTTQILPADPIATERKMLDFWKYIETLKPEDWTRHIVYIYRTEPRITTYNDGSSALEKSTGYFEVRPGFVIPFNSQEEIELAIREKHGGKAFRFILKRGSERIAESRCANDMPPKFPPVGMSTMSADQPSAGLSVGAVSEANATADVAKTAMATMAGQERQSTEIAISALRSSAEIIQRLGAGNGGGSESDQLMKQAMAALLQRALNPPDPLELLTRILPLINAGSNRGGNGTQSPVLDRLVDTAIERLLNPATNGPASASAGAELVRQLPGVAGYVTQAIREWRAGMEAQRDTAAIMSGTARAPAAAGPQPGAGTHVPNPAILPPPQPQAHAPQPGEPMPVPLEFIESKIIEILQEGNTADDTADDTLTFLQRMDPQLIVLLSSQGKTGLLQLFQTRPILKPATQNMPRLIEFIDAFLKLANADKPPAPPAAA